MGPGTSRPPYGEANNSRARNPEVNHEETLKKKCPIATKLKICPRTHPILRTILGNRAASCVDRLARAANTSLYPSELTTIEVLLLGTGDAGKSTICKQLMNIYGPYYDDSSFRMSFAKVIIGNIVDGTLQVLNRMDERGLEKYKVKRERTFTEAQHDRGYLSPECAEIIRDLFCNDGPFRRTIQTKADAVQLHDCYEYFCQRLANYPQWGGKQWVPSKDDCIRARARTFGVNAFELESNITASASGAVQSSMNISIKDVGGQRAERKKWLGHNISSPTNSSTTRMMVFVVGLSEYNQALFEDRKKNRLEESLDLFTECVNSEWLRDVPVVLVFNKKDLFDKKFLVEKIPLNVSGRFPDAPNQTNDANSAIDWLASKFSQRRKGHSRGSLPIHVISATDTANVRAVFTHCVELTLQRQLKTSGFSSNSPNVSSKRRHAHNVGSSLSVASSGNISEDSM